MFSLSCTLLIQSSVRGGFEKIICRMRTDLEQASAWLRIQSFARGQCQEISCRRQMCTLDNQVRKNITLLQELLWARGGRHKYAISCGLLRIE